MSDVKDGGGQVTLADVKGQLLMAVVEAGTEDTGSDSYQQSKEGSSRKEGI